MCPVKVMLVGMNDLRQAFDWRGAIRDYRKLHRLSQPEVARRAGLSVSAVKAYESGARHPTLETLTAIIDAMGMPMEAGNRVRAGAGYAIDWYAILNERFVSDPEALADEVEQFPWPVFVTNQAADLLFANRATQSVLGLDLARDLRGVGEQNFLARASDPKFAARMENWDEVITFLIGIAKGDPRYAHNLERPAAPVQDAVRKFLSGDPAYILRMLNLWDAAPPIPHRTRLRYNVRWRAGDGRTMRFLCVISVADLWDELAWHDWTPADGETWVMLDELRRGTRS